MWGAAAPRVFELELLVTLFLDDQILEHLVSSTNAYAQLKKSQKPAMYKRFQLYTLTKEEMLRYLGVLVLLSVNSVRSYRQVWNPKSSQVGTLYGYINISCLVCNITLYSFTVMSCSFALQFVIYYVYSTCRYLCRSWICWQ